MSRWIWILTSLECDGTYNIVQRLDDRTKSFRIFIDIGRSVPEIEQSDTLFWRSLNANEGTNSIPSFWEVQKVVRQSRQMPALIVDLIAECLLDSAVP